MQLPKIKKSKLDILVSGKGWGNYNCLLYLLSIGEINPNKCECTLEEYELYVKKAKEICEN